MVDFKTSMITRAINSIRAIDKTGWGRFIISLFYFS